jgi:nicotinate-nucleotide pyrophosphorylase (carboxylating)
LSHRISVEDSLKSFLAEDVGYGDITTDAIITVNQRARARVTCKEDAIVAGLHESLLLLKLVGCIVTLRTEDGEKVNAGTDVLVATGLARELLKIERTLLNILSHMSGIATITGELVNIVKKTGNPNVRIAATRKTLPGLRFFEKKAVELGGGDTHRLGLDDAVLIKDNHLTLTGSLTETVRRARSQTSFTKKIEAEVTQPGEAVTAAKAGADIVLLDNMTPQMIRESVSRLRTAGLRNKILLEASGRINKSNLTDYIRTGVDIISVGAITHSAKSIDYSMTITPVKRK